MSVHMPMYPGSLAKSLLLSCFSILGKRPPVFWSVYLNSEGWEELRAKWEVFLSWPVSRGNGLPFFFMVVWLWCLNSSRGKWGCEIIRNKHLCISISAPGSWHKSPKTLVSRGAGRIRVDLVMPRVRVPKTERIRRPQQCKSIKGFITSSSQGLGFIQHSGIRQRPRALNHIYLYLDSSLFL